MVLTLVFIKASFKQAQHFNDLPQVKLCLETGTLRLNTIPSPYLYGPMRMKQIVTLSSDF